MVQTGVRPRSCLVAVVLTVRYPAYLRYGQQRDALPWNLPKHFRRRPNACNGVFGVGGMGVSVDMWHVHERGPTSR